MSEVKEGKPAADSLRGWLQEARKRAQARKTIDLPIPRFEGRLWCTFRALDDALELKEIANRHDGLDEDTANLYVTVETLIAACVDTYVLQAGKKIPLGKKLGLELFEYLELVDEETGERLPAENDRQAAFAIFDSTTLLALTAEKYTEFLTDAAAETDSELEGNSVAPS